MTGMPNRPTIDTDSESWWAAVQDHTLMVNNCRSCTRTSLYVRPFCPHCWSEDVALAPASGRARLYTWSVIHQNAAPFAERTPYALAMVDLFEGPRIMTVVEDCSFDELRADLELVLAFRDDDDGFVVPVFRPAADGAASAGNHSLGEHPRPAG
ncbi:OB-fold domain-containing protein [Mycobacterium sp.]|uniref:Zn-ribbon domain-containing OB-fold protein n=1 Tax=Mycobacterium sp. TaxID=1785 RepID=UPI0025E84569|nr:OB-fold domain-containing protein [Mycobacterium sp.]